MEPKLIESNWQRSEQVRQTSLMKENQTRTRIPKSVTMVQTESVAKVTPSYTKSQFYEMLNPELVSNSRSVRKNLQKTFLFERVDRSVIRQQTAFDPKLPISRFDDGELSQNMSLNGQGTMFDDSKYPMREPQDDSIYLADRSYFKPSDNKSTFAKKDRTLELEQKDSKTDELILVEDGLLSDREVKRRTQAFMRAFLQQTAKTQLLLVKYLEAQAK